MKFWKLMSLWVLLVNISFASIRDSNGIASDGIISNGEYGYNVWVDDTSVLTFTGGGSDDVALQDTSHLEVISTKTPLSDGHNGGGIYNITPSDYSTVSFSGGVANYIYVQKNATVLLNGGQINLIRSVQKPTVGKTMTIECCEGWSWIYDGDKIDGITGQWYKHSNDQFTIKLLNDSRFPDTWTHVEVITPEPTTIALLSLGGLLLKKSK